MGRSCSRADPSGKEVWGDAVMNRRETNREKMGKFAISSSFKKEKKKRKKKTTTTLYNTWNVQHSPSDTANRRTCLVTTLPAGVCAHLQGWGTSTAHTGALQLTQRWWCFVLFSLWQHALQTPGLLLTGSNLPEAFRNYALSCMPCSGSPDTWSL